MNQMLLHTPIGSRSVGLNGNFSLKTSIESNVVVVLERIAR
jgi:hypothetical protein